MVLQIIMKLSVALIIHELSNFPDPPAVIYDKPADENDRIDKVRLYTKEQFRDDVIYISSNEKISERNRPKHIFVSGLPKTTPVSGVVYFALSLTELFNKIDDLFDSYRAIESRLNAAMARNDSLRSILSICSDFFCGPVALFDGHLRLIEASGNVADENVPDFIKSMANARFIDQSIMSAFKKHSINKRITVQRQPIFIRLNEVPATCFICGIFDGSKYISGLFVFEVSTALHESQCVIVDQITEIIDNHLFRDAMHSGSKSLPVSRMVNAVWEVIDGKIISDDIMQDYLHEINWQTGDTYFFLMVQAVSDKKNNGLSFYTYASIQKYFPGSLAVENDDFALILVNTVCARYNVDDAVELARLHVGKSHDKVVVSRRFSDFRFLHEHYTAVCESMKIAEIIDSDKDFYYYDDYAFPLMLKLCGSVFDLRIFCLYEAIVLYEYDKLHGRNFFRSLYLYLLNNRSLAVSAKILDVHPNTLLYRIGRARDILGLDIDDAKTCEALLRSYEILRIRKLIIDTDVK